MSKTTNSDTDTDTKRIDQEDQYDDLLRAFSEGVLLTLNNSVVQPAGTGELKVQYSNNNKTRVGLRGNNGEDYQIHRTNEELVYSEVTEDGLRYEDDVISFEIIGIE